MSTSTGPGRPVLARWNASAIARGISAGSVTRKLCLVIGRVMPQMSASWNAAVPVSGRGWGGGGGGGGEVVGPRGGGGAHADADLAGRLRVAGGRVARALLVADQDV